MERGKELLRTVRALVSELEIWIEEWTELLPFVKSALNNVQSIKMKISAVITIVIGMEPSTRILTFIQNDTI